MIEILGLVATTVMVASYALEARGSIFIAIFAFGCAMAATYAFLIGSYPFLIAEGLWSLIAFRRWRVATRKPIKPTILDPQIIKHSNRIEDILRDHEIRFPANSDFIGYRNHCIRMLNVALIMSKGEPHRLEKLEIALAFHDLTVFPGKTLDYLDSSSEPCTRLPAVN